MSVEAEVYGSVGFVVAAVAFSLFYGFKATEIFSVSADGKKWPWKVHQFWLNFSGSVVGWIALWFLGTRVVKAFSDSYSAKFGLPSALLFALAFIGITGYLPMTVVNLINSIGALVGRIAGLPEPASDKDRTK